MKKGLGLLLALTAMVLNAADIHYDSKADAAVKFAAEDMARCLSAVTGKTYQAKVARVVGDGDIVLEKDSRLRSQEWRLQNKNGKFFIQGGDTFGIVYGVYAFLEKHVGCSWLAPDTELLPKQADWKLPEINETGRPAFLRREMYVGEERGNDRMDPYWRMRNKENQSAALNMNMRYGRPNDCHCFDYYVKVIKDPKLFGPRKGGGKCTTLCMTNPEVRKLVLAELIRYIEKDRANKGQPEYTFPRLYELGQTDGPSWPECWCDSCRKLAETEGSYAGPNIDFVNYMAEGVKNKYPEIRLVTFAYSYTMQPPKNIKAADNVLIRYCGATLYKPLLPGTEHGKLLQEWRRFASKKSIWSYWRTYDGMLCPFVKKRQDIAGEIRFCHKEGVEHYFAENEAPLSRSFAMQQHWLMLKMLENPGQDIEKLNDKFMVGYYGKAAPVLKEYLEYLEKRETEARTHLDKEFFEKVNTWLDQAEELVKDDPRSLLHVHWERVVVDRTMYQNLSALLKAGYKPDLPKISARFESNIKDLLKSWKILKDTNALDKRLADAEQEADLYAHFPVDIPKQFEGCDVYDIHWSRIDGQRIKDPDAICGMAVMNPKYRHKATYNVGFYNSALRIGSGIDFRPEDFPQDEKFHLYKLGKALIMRPLDIILDDSWEYRTFLSTISIIPEMRDIWISMKFAGPAYVKGSKSKNAVLFDRILLVKDPNPLRGYKPLDPGKNLLKNGNFEEFSKDWVSHWGKITPHCRIDADVKHSGSASLRIDGDKTGAYWLEQNLGKVEDLKNDLLIRGWCKYSGIRTEGDLSSQPFVGLWTLTDKGQNTTYNTSLVQFYVGSYDWLYFESLIDIGRFKKACRRAKPSPAYQVNFTILLYHQLGTVWLDDVEVIPLEKNDPDQ